MNSVDDVKIGDFGLVKRLKFVKDDQFSKIQTFRNFETDEIKNESNGTGTAFYSAPEQIDLDCHTFDQRMDIYPLGVIIF